ncbi:RNA-binding protein [Janthinobacterium sp. BJB446]|uniref:vWA domain-containing protein n=1 Tax=Janthinobacterium sp. BJB446 TaxID=2048009 RepID=UPI000C0FD2AE|nr:TROVE domain-containing protein [Janthinobacterium sp. BJB446]PHV19090.1 RNA-binding protein [Janthinobacterium sp. BJB446]
MANAQLFQSAQQTETLPAALARNAEGAPAYALTPRHQLAQYAATGCLNTTFYASAEAQLATVLELCQAVDPAFIAQTAVYCRERGYMKDMPALLVAVLAGQGAAQFAPAFWRVINNGKMLRNFVQIMRSGAVGRKSLGSRPKKLVQAWLNTASEQALLAAAVGNAPSLADVVKMVHPKPQEAWREAFFAWLIGKPYDAKALPPALAAFEAYKADPSQAIPDVPFQMLTALSLSAQDWAQIARQGSWQMVRMNLNTFGRHGVYAIAGMPELIAAKLRDPEAIGRARVFPYQLLSAYLAAGESVPAIVRDALEAALEIALANVPRIAGRVVVCPDVSGSMSSPVSGFRGSATSSVRCIDVAALVAAAMLRKNPDAMLLPFEHSVVTCGLAADDSVMVNAAKLAAIGGGGTNCSAPLMRMNSKKALADLVIYVSDNESWIDAKHSGATATMGQWKVFKQRNPQAKLVCIDIAPHATTQAMECEDILNIGGFSDDVFKIIAAFAAGQLDPAHWVGEIAAIDIAATGC